MTAERDTDVLALVARGDHAALEAALQAGADPDAGDRGGVSALARAAARGDPVAVDLLLAHGAEVDRPSSAGNTALMAAAARGHLDAMQRLLDAGAEPEHRNNWGLTAHDWAQWPANAAEVRALLHGRDPAA